MLRTNQFRRDAIHLGIAICLFFLVNFKPVAAVEAAAQRTQKPMIFLIDISGSMNDPLYIAEKPQQTKKSKLVQVKDRMKRLAGDLPAGTRVIVSLFDDQWFELCDLVLDSPLQRQQLMSKIEGVKTRNRATVLWGSVANELARAERLVKSGIPSVQLVVYSDGDDSDPSPAVSHESLLHQYGHIINRHIQMDWVTLGYEIKPPVKNKLESLGVQVTSKLVPSRIDFDLSRKQLMVGETLRLTGRSSGISIAKHGVDWGDGSREYIPPERENDHPTIEHRFDRPGTFSVRYYISTQSGRRENLAKHVTVLPPNLPRVTIQTNQSTIRIGSPTKFFVQPSLKNVTCRWDTADGQRDDSPTASFRFGNVGMTKVRLAVTDEWGQTQRAETSVYVAPPEQGPSAEFEIPDDLELVPGSPVALVAFGSDMTDQVQWSVDSMPVSNEREFYFVPDEYGHIKIGLRVLDRFGRMDRQQKVLVVPRPHKPSAGVSVASSEIRLGDSVVLTDESLGVIDECRYSVSGKPDWTAKESLGEPTSRTFRWKPEELGQFEIVQTVVGPGGQDSAKATVVVVPKGDRIVADFGVDWSSNRGATEVYFTNLSLGDVYRCEFDPGDGSEPVIRDGLADFQFQFQPGVWQPTITLYPLPDSGWSPVVWESEPIEIREPVSTKTLLAAASAPVLFVCGFGLVAYRRRQADRAHEQSRQRVQGSVTFRSLDNPLEVRTVEFDGQNEVEPIALSNEVQIELRAAPDPMSDDFRVRMKVDDPELETARMLELAAGETVEVGEYAITYDA